MAGKKDDKPYLPFYIGDWFKAPEIRAMPHANRMVWFEILCLMWQSDEKGYLTINKKPFVITNVITGEITKGQQVLASMLGVSCDFLQESFKIFKDYGVYSIRSDGAIFSRFMTKLVDIQSVKSMAGKKGMEKRYGKAVITDVITSVENENEIKNDVSAQKFNQNPNYEEIGDLPDIKNGVVIELIKITKSIDVDKNQINGLWNVFKQQSLTGNKFYQSINDVYSHFINWTKMQKFDNGKLPFGIDKRTAVIPKVTKTDLDKYKKTKANV